MLLLALALSGVTAAPMPAPVLQRAPVKRVKTVKRVKKVRVPVRAQPNTMRIPIVATPRDPNQAYRLGDTGTRIVDGKDRAVQNTGMECETTGAPVCPSKGTTIVKTPIDD